MNINQIVKCINCLKFTVKIVKTFLNTYILELIVEKYL